MILLALLLCADSVVIPAPVECGTPQGCSGYVSRPVHLLSEMPPAEPPEPIRVLVEPVPMDWARASLGSGKTPAVGRWLVTFSGRPSAEISWEAVNVAMAANATLYAIPKPVFLSDAEAFPIIERAAGGRWPKVRRYLMLAGLIAGTVALAQNGNNSEHARKIAASIGAFQSVTHLLADSAGNRIPNVSALRADRPAKIVIPASGGITFGAWSAKMSQRRQAIGPFEVYPQ